MPLDIGSAIGTVRIDYSAVRRAVAAIQSSLGRLSGGDSAFAKVGKSAEAGLGKVNKSAGSAEDSIKKLSTTLDKINPAVMLGVGAAAAAAAGLVVKSAFDMNSTLETTQLQFETLMGSTDAAREHVAFLFEFAKKTPFETGPIIEASRMLQTFGGAALNTEENLTLIGDASAAVSAPINELGFWVGRLYSNLKGGQPFGEAAMRLQELAVLSPQARQQMEALQESGASADEVFALFQANLGNFTGAMEKQAGTWSGMISTLKDSLQLASAEGMKPFFDSAKEGIASTIAALNSPEFVAGVKDFAAGLGSALKVIVPLAVEHGPLLLKVLTGVGVALGTLSVSLKVAAGIATLKTAFAGLTGASAAAGVASSGALAGTMAALTPLLPVIGLVVAAVGLLAVAWAKDWGGIRAKTAEAIESIRGIIDKGLAQWRGFWEKHGDGIVKFAGHLWAAVKSHFAAGMTVVSNILQAAGALLRGDWEELGRHLSEAAHAWIDGWRETFSHLGDAIGPALEAAGQRIAAWWNGIDWEELARQALAELKAGFTEGESAADGPIPMDGLFGMAANSGYAAGARAREQFLAGWEQGAQEPTTDAWVERAAAEAAAAMEDAARSAESADRVLLQHANNYEYVARAATTAGRALSSAAVYIALSGERSKLAADDTGKFAAGLGQLGEKARAALDELNAAKAAAEAYAAAFAAVQVDYVTELPGGDEPLVAPEQTVSIVTGGLSEGDAALLSEYRGEVEKLQEELYNLTNGIGTFGVEQGKINEMISGAQGELAHYQELMAPLEGVVGEVSTAHRGLSVNVDAVHQGIYDQLVQMGAAQEVITAYAVATGIMSEEQARAVLQAAAVKVEIERLALKIAEGLPIETALADLDSFIQKIETGVTPATETMAADVPARVVEMKDAMSEGALAAGEAVPAGITEGINTRLEEATTAAEGAATDVVDAVKNVFGVESPSTVFAEIGGELMAGLRDGVEDGAAAVITLVEETAEQVLGAWDEFIDRAPNVGKAIMLGVMEGIEDYRGMLIAIMKEIARQAYEEMMAAIYAYSPSRLFMNTGRAIIEGIVVGLEENEWQLTEQMNALGQQLGTAAGEIGGLVGASFLEAVQIARAEMWEDILQQLEDADHPEEVDTYLEGLGSMYLDMASTLAGIAGGFEDVFEATTIDPLQAKLDDATDNLEGYDDIILGLADSLGLVERGLISSNAQLLEWSPAQAAAFIANLQGAPFAEFFDADQIAGLNVLQGLLHDRNDLLVDQAAIQAELTAEMERQAALEEKRAQLKFLQDQMELVELIRENGLSTSILDGLELGLDADAGALMDAMVAAMSELVAAAEEELDIASPSRVFRDIGEQIMDGLAAGIDSVRTPTDALREQFDALGRVFNPARSPINALQTQLQGVEAGLESSMDAADALGAHLGRVPGTLSAPADALGSFMGRLNVMPPRALGGLLGQQTPQGAALTTNAQTVNIFGGLHYDAAGETTPGDVLRSLYRKNMGL